MGQRMTDHTPGQFCTDPCTVCNDRPTTHTYWLSIGRNVPSTENHYRPAGPLSDRLWEGFKSDLRMIVTNHDGTILAEVNGTSEWEGIAEDTYLALVTIPAYAVPNVRNVLDSLRRYYCQDAIGIVGGAGTDTLIGGK
jgi:hypothetical protein